MPMDKMEMIRSVLDTGARKVKEGKHKILVDAYSASAITQVYDSLEKPENKAKYAALPIAKMADIAFKLINKGESK